MKVRPTHIVALALTLGQGWSLAASQTNPSVADRQSKSTSSPDVLSQEVAVESDDALNMANAQYRLAQSQLAEAELAEQTKAMRIQAGIESSSELPSLKVKIEEAKLHYQKAKRNLALAQRYAALAKPVQISVKNVRLQQAASLLSRLSTMSIHVGKAVPNDITVTASTTSGTAPLGSVLESLAYMANVTIETGADGGLTLEVPTKMIVNGKNVTTRGGAWPWGDDLVTTTETVNVPVGQRWKLISRGDVDLTGTSRTLQTTTSLGLRSPAAQTVNVRAVTPDLLSQATITALGSNTLVITEPGIGPKGETGLWLSLYAVKNGLLVFKSEVFHRAKDTFDRTRLGIPEPIKTIRTRG